MYQSSSSSAYPQTNSFVVTRTRENMRSEVNTSSLHDTKRNRWFDVIKRQAINFCLATGFHGYKYIVQSNRTRPERYIWAIVVACSFCCSLIFMHMAWEYNASHSTLTVIESTHHGIWNYPFPAVTVCNNNQVSLQRAREFARNLTVTGGVPRDYIFGEMRLLTEMLDPGVFDYDVQANLSLLQDVFDANNYSISEVMKMVSQDCSSLLKNCKWKGNATPCHELFEEVYARDGVCCSFNYFTSENKNQNKREPKRLTACGYQTGLAFLADPEPDDYFSSLYGSYGFKVMLHHPYNYPDRSAEFQLIGMGVQNFLGISPEVTYSTPGVLELPVAARDCIYGGEKLPVDLRYQKQNFTWLKYSYVNCLNECRASVTVSRCGCVPYYLPQNGSRVCNLKDVKCLARIRSAYDTSRPGVSVKSAELADFMIDIKKRPCGCLPDCKVYRYPVDSTQGTIIRQSIYNLKMFANVEDNRNASLVNVFFTDLVSIQYRRDIFFNWRNLFASFGGLLGLFVGFSLMTAFELFYFFIVRVIADTCISKRNKSHVVND